MKVLKAVVIAAVLGVVVFAATAKAAEGDKPLFDWSRLSFAGGLNYVWYAAPFDKAAPVPTYGKEWEVGIYGAYNLTPHLSIAGSTVYGFDNKNVQDRIGLRVRFGKKSEAQ